MIVVDVNVLVAMLISSSAAADVEQVQRRDSVWIAPPLWRSEIRNVFAGYIRRSTLTVDQAEELFSAAEALVVSDVIPSVERVFELVTASSCTAYDLEYVAVAMVRRLTLVTLDRQILREFPAIALTPQQFLAR